MKIIYTSQHERDSCITRVYISNILYTIRYYTICYIRELSPGVLLYDVRCVPVDVQSLFMKTWRAKGSIALWCLEQISDGDMLVRPRNPPPLSSSASSVTSPGSSSVRISRRHWSCNEGHSRARFRSHLWLLGPN